MGKVGAWCSLARATVAAASNARSWWHSTISLWEAAAVNIATGQQLWHLVTINCISGQIVFLFFQILSQYIVSSDHNIWKNRKTVWPLVHLTVTRGHNYGPVAMFNVAAAVSERSCSVPSWASSTCCCCCRRCCDQWTQIFERSQMLFNHCDMCCSLWSDATEFERSQRLFMFNVVL